MVSASVNNAPCAARPAATKAIKQVQQTSKACFNPLKRSIANPIVQHHQTGDSPSGTILNIISVGMDCNRRVGNFLFFDSASCMV